MAYTKTTWTDRVLDGSGNPIVTGTALSAANLNKLETGVSDAHSGLIVFPDGTASLPSITFSGDTDTGVYHPAANQLAFTTNATEAFRVSSAQRFIYGNTIHTNARIGTTAVAPNFQILGTTDNHAALIGKYSADNASTRIYFTKSRRATMGTSATTGHTIVQSGDALGTITFAGSDGTDGDATTPKYVEAARIQVEVDGTPGISDMPGRIVISTTADGGATPTERMRIDNTGAITVNSSAVLNNALISTTIAGIGIGSANTAGNYRTIKTSGAAGSLQLDFANGNNTAYLTSGGTWTSVSDARLKKNIKEIKYGLDTVISSKPRSFERNDVGGEYIGFIAQELKEIIPEVVYGDELIQYNVDYGSLVAIAFKAIQELSAEVETLKARLSK